MAKYNFEKINEDALQKWFDAEWEKQSELVGPASEAFDILRIQNEGGCCDTEEYNRILERIDELNALLCTYSKQTVKFPKDIVSAEQVRNARKIIDSLDQIEEAGYDKASMKILLPPQLSDYSCGVFQMLSFVITNHLYQKFGTFCIYGKWLNPCADYGWYVSDIDKIKTAIYRHCRFMLSIRYCHMTDPITGNKIQPPEEFYLE